MQLSFPHFLRSRGPSRQSPNGIGCHCKRIAQKLKNPRLLQIHFHTLRHWKATMLYQQTKDILYIKKFLGHKNVENTLVYIQLEEALFQESDEFTVRVAENLDEAVKLMETGFEYVTKTWQLERAVTLSKSFANASNMP